MASMIESMHNLAERQDLPRKRLRLEGDDQKSKGKFGAGAGGAISDHLKRGNSMDTDMMPTEGRLNDTGIMPIESRLDDDGTVNRTVEASTEDTAYASQGPSSYQQLIDAQIISRDDPSDNAHKAAKATNDVRQTNTGGQSDVIDLTNGECLYDVCMAEALKSP